MSKILVTGATGMFGTAAIRHLLDRGVPAGDISALVRDEAKAAPLKELGIALKKGDYDDYDSLVRAFRGTEKLLFVSGSEVEKRMQQHENVVNAAKEAGVGHVVYTSFQRSEHENEADSPLAAVAASHIRTEEWLEASGMKYTFMRNNLYADLIPMFIGEGAVDRGVIFQPAGDGKMALLLRDEMAEAAAAILTGKGHENRAYNISSDTSVSYGDIAGFISEATGKQVGYVSPTVEEYGKAMAEAGVPPEMTGFLTGFALATAQGEFDHPTDTVEKLIGRKPTPVSRFLHQVYASGN